MKIIGFAGPKGSGKDTAFEMMKRKGRIKAKLSFAGPLKQICSKIFELPPTYFDMRELKEKQLKEPKVLTNRVLRNILNELPKWLPETHGKYRKYNLQSVSVAGLEGLVLNSPREILQIIGTDLIRGRVYNNWHIEATLGAYALSKLDQNATYAVTDVRFINELETILAIPNGEVYYIERPEAEDTLGNAKHESELESIKIKEKLDSRYILKNTGDLKDFEKLLSALINPPTKRKNG